MEQTINETVKLQGRNMPNRLSNVFEDIDSEEFLSKSDDLINKNLDEDSESNKIIQNMKEYEYTAPLTQDEDLDPNSRPNIRNYQPMSNSKSSTNIQTYNSNNSITNGQRVKFLSDYSINNLKNQEQTERLLSNDEHEAKANRFKIAHVNDPKKIFDENENKYFFDEKGLIIKKSEVKKPRKDLNEAAETDSKAIQFKYNKDSKSLEVSINIGNSDSKENGCFTQLKYIGFYQALFAELLGTYLLVLYVCNFGLAITESGGAPAGINGCLGSGLLVASLVWCLGHVGGANLNPAVSIALLVTGESNLVRVFFYIACQLLGSMLAALTLIELVPDHLIRPVNKLALNTVRGQFASLANDTSNELRLRRDLHRHINSNRSSDEISPVAYANIGLTLLSDQITPLQGYLVEVIITFILVFCIFSCIDKRRKDLTGSFPLTIGFAVTVGALFGGNFTGGSMNPARSFGPAFVMQNWDNHWIYWAGPISGGILAGLVYKLLVVKKKYFIKK